MLDRPVLPPDPVGPWTLRRVARPDIGWFRDLQRRVGEEWLWFSRARMSDAEVAAIMRAPQVEFHALVQDGRDEGLLELDFRQSGECELVFFGVTDGLIGTGAGRPAMWRDMCQSSNRQESFLCRVAWALPTLLLLRLQHRLQRSFAEP
jgi:hypothetical protein